jgi:hypothetical protein
MACDPFDAMKVATESFDEDLLRRASPTSLWLNAIPRGKYPQGVGINQTTFIIANSEPTSDNEEWTDITLNTDTNQIEPGCDITYEQVEVGFIEQNYGPRQFGLKGPVICKDNLTFQHNAVQFLLAYEQEMAKRSKRSWEFEMRRTYMDFSQKIIDGNLVDEGSSPVHSLTTVPTSELTQDILDVVAGMLIDSDANQPDETGYVTLSEEGPLFTLYIGVDASQKILRNDPERRIDARYAIPSELFKRLGATRVIGNFRHAITTIPPRFNIVDGHITSVPTFVMVTTTQGKRAKRNPDWVDAEIEAAIVVLTSVFEAEVVVPISAAGNFVNFDPTSYFGEWSFVTGAFRLGLDCTDPLEKFGQHYAEFKYAPKPMFPEHGKVILFKRCPLDITLSYCD